MDAQLISEAFLLLWLLVECAVKAANEIDRTVFVHTVGERGRERIYVTFRLLHLFSAILGIAIEFVLVFICVLLWVERCMGIANGQKATAATGQNFDLDGPLEIVMRGPRGFFI
jgi:hypothetical protein